jgi:hypothetical protein
MTTDDLVAFITARLDEDEAAAKAAAKTSDASDWPVLPGTASPYLEFRTHVARHAPARVLRDVNAKRAILADHKHIKVEFGRVGFGCIRCEDDSEYPMYGDGWCKTVRQFGAVWSDHPDFRPEWVL